MIMSEPLFVVLVRPNNGDDVASTETEARVGTTLVPPPIQVGDDGMVKALLDVAIIIMVAIAAAAAVRIVDMDISSYWFYAYRIFEYTADQ